MNEGSYPVQFHDETIAWFESQVQAIEYGSRLALHYPTAPIQVLNRLTRPRVGAEPRRVVLAEFFPRHDIVHAADKERHAKARAANA